MSKEKIQIDALPCPSNKLGLMYKSFIVISIISLIIELVIHRNESQSYHSWGSVQDLDPMVVVGGLTDFIGGILACVFFYYISKSLKELGKGLSGLVLTYGIIFAATGMFAFNESLSEFSEESEVPLVLMGIVVIIGLIMPLIIGIIMRKNYDGKLKLIGDDFLWLFALTMVMLRVEVKLDKHSEGPFIMLMICAAAAQIIVYYRVMSRLTDLCSGEGSCASGEYMDMSE